MRCLIIAAGQGSRLRSQGEIKPLVPINGIPLIEHVIRNSCQAGADGFVVVTGCQGQRIRARLDILATKFGVPIEHVENLEWHKPNGVSVLKARDLLQQRFALLMSDHLFEPKLLGDLWCNADEGVTTLAVDTDLENPLVDLEDVTRVEHRDGRILSIGKELEHYNGFDTGIFACTPALFEAIETSIATTNDGSLSGGMRVLSANGLARVFAVQKRFWIDVDDAAALARAEEHLASV